MTPSGRRFMANLYAPLPDGVLSLGDRPLLIGLYPDYDYLPPLKIKPQLLALILEAKHTVALTLEATQTAILTLPGAQTMEVEIR